MREYNKTFGTDFNRNTFDAYRKDISKRLKQKSDKQIDILFVVDMFLTGFDARPLNTLYLDKDLQWHGLIQAYSRTNRVYKKTKICGNIVTYRNLKKRQDEALALFSGNGDPNVCIRGNYEDYLRDWTRYFNTLRSIAKGCFLFARFNATPPIIPTTGKYAHTFCHCVLAWLNKVF